MNKWSVRMPPSLWITIIETIRLLKPSTLWLISRHPQYDDNFEHMLTRCINAPQIIVNWVKMKHMEIMIVLISWCVSFMVVIVSFQFVNDLLFSTALRMAATPRLWYHWRGPVWRIPTPVHRIAQQLWRCDGMQTLFVLVVLCEERMILAISGIPQLSFSDVGQGRAGQGRTNFILCRFYIWTKQYKLCGNTRYFPTSEKNRNQSCKVLHINPQHQFNTRIFDRGVPGFATDCPCGVWWRGLTTCPLYIGPLFWNLVYNDSRLVSLT